MSCCLSSNFPKSVAFIFDELPGSSCGRYLSREDCIVASQSGSQHAGFVLSSAKALSNWRVETDASDKVRLKKSIVCGMNRPTGRWHSTTILRDNAPVTAGSPVQYCNRFIFPLPGQVVPVVGSLLEIPNCYSYRSWSDSQATLPKRNLASSKSVDKTDSTARKTDPKEHGRGITCHAVYK